MLRKRVISGLLFLPVFYVVAWELPAMYLTGLVVVASAIGQYEFYRMARNKGVAPLSAAGIVLGAAFIIGVFYQRTEGDVSRHLFALTACLLVIMVGRLFSPGPVDGALEDVAVTLLGIAYVSLLFGFQVGIRLADYGREWFVFLYFVIWATDIGAYSIGIPFGRHRLSPRISPKKSVEGLAGGLVAAGGMAIFCRWWFMPPLSMTETVVLGLLLAAAGTIGDLVESILKRSAGVKDSGGVIPGHGGMLDRMDSMLFAAPVLYYYLKMR